MGIVTKRKTCIVEPRWYVASCGDGDTHLAESTDGELITPRCDRPPFRPFNSMTQLADAEQGCPECLLTRGTGR